jgi:thymidylate synthase
MKQYLDSLQHILDNGKIKEDRTGVGTIALFGHQMRFDLSKGFPAVTTKRLAFKACLSELLWFIEGSSDEHRLREILHGSEAPNKTTIWTANAEADYWKPRARYQGDLGRVYGVQWRKWQNGKTEWNQNMGMPVPVEIDQLTNLIEEIKTNPTSRRLILTAWNPGEIENMALPPCHCFAQFFVQDSKLSCQLYQRSCDMFLGVPFNIASYSILTHMIAQVCGLGVGEFIWTGGDCHVYQNHIEQVKLQLTRQPKELPTLWLNPDIKDIDKFTMSDVIIQDYNPIDSIKAEMAV